MPRRSKLCRRTRRSEAVRRVIVNKIEEEQASANDSRRLIMAQIREDATAEPREARLEDALLTVQRSCSAALDLLRSQHNKRGRLRMANRGQRETTYQRQIRLPGQQSHD